MQCVIKSLADPTNLRYAIYEDCTHFWDQCHRGGAGRFLNYSIGQYEVMGDGETQHCPSSPVRIEQLPDFGLSFGQWWTLPGLHEDAKRIAWQRVGSNVNRALGERLERLARYCMTSLKYDAEAAKRVYFSLTDTDKKDNPRKSTDPDKRHDKRWIELHQYNGAGTADAAYRCLVESRVVDWSTGLEIVSGFDLLRDLSRSCGGWESKNTFEWFETPSHPITRNHGPHMQALNVLRACFNAYEAEKEIERETINSARWLSPNAETADA